MVKRSVLKKYIKVYGLGFTVLKSFVRLRMILLRVLRQGVAYPIFANPFSKMCSSLSDTLTQTDFKEAHIASQTKISGPVVASYPFHGDLGPAFRREKAYDGKWAYTLTDMNVSVENGLVWTPKNIFLAESIGGPNKLFSGPLEEMLFPMKDLGTDHPVILCPDTGFYHFIFEILPNILHLLDNFDVSQILVSKGASPYVFDALRLYLNREDFNNKVSVIHGSWYVKKLLFIPIPPISGFCHPFDIQRLRDFASMVHPEPSAWMIKKIYVSRKYATSRCVANEAEISARLTTLGFETVYLENMSIKEQIKLFKTTHTVVAPHGAGLSNMVWMNKGCKIIELMPTPMNDVYARLAVFLGFSYQVIFETDPAQSQIFSIDQISALLRRTRGRG